MDAQQLALFFQEKGEALMLPNNSSVSLQKRNKAWWIEQGALNLYFVKMENGVIGHRTFLAHFPASSLLFSLNTVLENSPFEILAVSEGDALLREIDTNDLDIGDFSRFLDQWIHAFASFYQHDISKEQIQFLPENGKVALLKDAFIHCPRAVIPSDKSKVFWIHILGGTLELQGRQALRFDQGKLYPVTYDIYLKSLSETTLEVYTSSTLLQNKLWHQGLRDFHELLAQYLIHESKKKIEEERERIKEKKEIEAVVLNDTFRDMAALISPLTTFSISSSLDPIYLACQHIGKLMGVQFIYPEDEQPETAELMISAICQTSLIRCRQIALKPDWWHQDSRHILGFFGRDQKPVALINSKPGIFEMFDPATGQKQRITEEIGRQISSIAYTFYRPFPDKLKTGKEVLWFCSKQHWRAYLSLIVYGTVAAILSLIPAFVISILYSTVIPDANLPLLFQLVIILALAAISATLFTFFRSLLLVRIEGVTNHEIQAAFWDRLLKLPTTFFRHYSSGDLFFRLYSIEEIRLLLSSRGIRVILAGIFSFFYFIAMAIYSFKLTLIALVVVVLVSLITAVACIFKIRIEKEILTLKTKINGTLTQILGAISKIRIAGSEARVFSYWASSFTKRKKLEMQAQQIQNIVTVSNAILPLFSLALIFAVALGLKKEGELQTWAFLAFDAAFVPFAFALFDLGNALLEMTPILSLWGKAKVILEEPQEITKKKNSPGRLKGEVSIDHVAFQYENNRPILRDISFQVSPGEFVGIVGQSGGGKSTLLRLLLGFEKPHSGAIFFDGKDLDTLNMHEVRRQLGVVLQGTSLVAGSIFDNIVCGGYFSREDIERALTLSGFQEDLKSFPMGLHTVITSGGETLSGGQKQRLLIARALISRPRILIFDEATNALDNKTQDIVSHNLDQLEVTRIVVAHRLSTLKQADRIYALDQGKIVQCGTFETLANVPGLFREMLIRQAL